MTGIINSRTCKAKIEKSPGINCKNRLYAKIIRLKQAPATGTMKSH